MAAALGRAELRLQANKDPSMNADHSTATARDVLDALIQKRPAPRIGVTDNIWGDTLKKWCTQGLPTQDDGEPVDIVDHFDFDMASCGGWFRWEATDGGEVIEETDDYRIVRNGNGAVLRWWQDKSGTPEHLEFDMTTRAVWDARYRPHLVAFDRDRLGDLDQARANLARRRAQGRWTIFGHMFIWEILRASLGDTAMYMALVEDPEWIHDFNRVYTDLFKAAYTALFDEVGLPDGVWIYEDLGYRDRLFCSPKTLTELIFPYYAEMVDFFHARELPVVLHSCGYQETMLPLAVDAGFDGINPMEVKAGNDILAYAERHGEQLTFFGGFDARILERGDRAEIRREVAQFVRGMRERGASFIFGSDHSISTNVDYADFCYFLEVFREQAY
jgi:uroporphyrinogen decarboxylase